MCSINFVVVLFVNFSLINVQFSYQADFTTLIDLAFLAQWLGNLKSEKKCLIWESCYNYVQCFPCLVKVFTLFSNHNAQCTTVRLCSEGVTKLFPKCFDRQNSIFLNPHGKRKPTPELHMSVLKFDFSRAIFLFFTPLARSSVIVEAVGFICDSGFLLRWKTAFNKSGF